MMLIFREFTFEAAHKLPCVADDHPCSRVHGHSYRVRVTYLGPVDEVKGWVFDWGLLDATIREVLLNDVLENPTCEVLTQWIAALFAVPAMGGRFGSDVRLASVEVRESPTTGASWKDE